MQDQEEKWLAALHKGDESAFRSIFNHYYEGMVRDAYRVLGNHDTARDIAQDVFVELWKKHETITIKSSFRAYLKKAVTNKSINFIQSNRLVTGDFDTVFNQIIDDDVTVNEQASEFLSLEQRLHSAIQGLPEKCRIVFSLSRFDRLSHKEIAMQLNISVKTIENQITKAMKAIRDAMNEHGDLSPIVIFHTFYTLLQ